jgi:hypothetical protein
MYQAAKFGLGGFTEALAKEVAPLGIRVTSIDPGGFSTDWAGASMTYAKPIGGYDLVQQRTEFFNGGKFIPVGNAKKAAKVMVDLAIHDAPPVHLVLGSDAIGILKSADAARQAELEKWMDVSLYADHDEADGFLETSLGKSFVSRNN